MTACSPRRCDQRLSVEWVLLQATDYLMPPALANITAKLAHLQGDEEDSSGTEPSKCTTIEAKCDNNE